MSKKKPAKLRIAYDEINHENLFCPGLDQNLERLENTPTDPKLLGYNANLNAFFAATGQEHRQHLFSLFNRHKRFREFTSAVELPAMVVAAENVRISKSIVTVVEKFLLSGASGTRMLVKTYQDSEDRFAELAQSMASKRQDNDGSLPLVEDDVRDLDFIVVAKNLFNYYHFTLETLPFLTLYKKYGLTGRVVIVSDSRRQGAFVQDQIDRFFPELADRVVLKFGNIRRKRALLVLDTKFQYFQSNDAKYDILKGLAPSSWLWREHDLRLSSYRTLEMNQVSSPLFALRDKVYETFSADPPNIETTKPTRRRLYVARRDSHRARPIQGGRDLVSMLEELGFETVYFEDHDVVGQAELVSQAEVIISVHGAGMTNMLYAPEGCLVIELSSLQISLLRFGDFNAFAVVSKARYLHFFIDHDWPDQTTVPDFLTHSIVGLKLDTNAVMMLKSLILAHLEPEKLHDALEVGKALNADKDKSPLRQHLIRNLDRMLHVADTHVWAANCAGELNLYGEGLAHLMQAVRIAPQDRRVLERALRKANQQGNTESFDSLASDYFFHNAKGAEKYFAKHGWNAEKYLSAG